MEGEASTGGGPLAAAFREVWYVDFEFNGEHGRPRPVCMVAIEAFSGRTIKLWRDDLLRRTMPPFGIGKDTLVVAYMATAELACFMALGWPPPANILDLFVEHRVETNAFKRPVRNSLLAALEMRGLAHIEATEKGRLRDLILSQDSWNEAEQREILDYCETDVRALAALLPAMAATIDMRLALWRGQYMGAVAAMEWTGIPIDHLTYARLQENWRDIRGNIIREIDGDFGVFDGQTFKHSRFAGFLAQRGILWPRLPSGVLALDRDVFGDMAKRYPAIQPLHDLRKMLSNMNGSGLSIGTDGRNRCSLWPFASVTGRNQPKAREFVFGPGRWLRHLIAPQPGYGLAYIDWRAQEVGIAAGLSGDERLRDAYLSGDPYMAFAVATGLAPQGATASSHPAVRNRCKAVVLGVGYGMGAKAIAGQAGISEVEAEDLLTRHRSIHRTYWSFSQRVIDSAGLTGKTRSVFGWAAQTLDAQPTSLMNFPMQANGAEMMRIAAIEAVRQGVAVAAPVHDAFLIEAPITELDEQTEVMREIMRKAGEVVCRIPIDTEARKIVHPQRLGEERGEAMWKKVTQLLGDRYAIS